MAGLADRFKASVKLSGSKLDSDDRGSAVDVNSGSIAGGGHAGVHSSLQDKLRVSPALRQYLTHEGVLSQEDARTGSAPETMSTALHDLVQRPHAVVPLELLDRNHPLCDYYISSSHNTYLMAHQLYGKSCPSGYETALRAGARCVEIDAWDNSSDPAEPKVTHGFTLVSHIPFRSVCETIRDSVDAEAARPGASPAPTFISLENHCGPEGQKRLVEIMKEVLGDRLLYKDIREETADGIAHHVQLAQLGSKVCVMVEYHFPNEPSDDDGLESDSSSSSSDEKGQSDRRKLRDEAHAAEKQYAAQKKTETPSIIIPELAALGVYAQSVKPPNNSWFESTLEGAPPHHLINISESGLAAHLPTHSLKVGKHNSSHLMRVYPKGTRISSNNLRPVPFWGIGAQVCALNWQTFGAAMQMNEALFTGSDGYVLKPSYLRHDSVSEPPKQRKRLRLRVAGATDVPDKSGEGKIKPYVSCQLIHPADFAPPPKRKTDGYKPHSHLRFLNSSGDEAPPVTDPVWDQTLEWEYDDDELVFLRILLKSDDRFARNPVIAAGCVRLLYATRGWSFIRLLDLQGRETMCTLLVNTAIEDI